VWDVVRGSRYQRVGTGDEVTGERVTALLKQRRRTLTIRHPSSARSSGVVPADQV
jgi:hypothetical protein